ncbi:MAG TPA: hypothetical protein VMT79_12115 [Candidatus Binatia bacterium]|nr:hypothetical protein [Candidatus Binatia bacterium]
MHVGSFVLALVLYVAGDLSNPLLPGAVGFADGFLEVVEAGATKHRGSAPRQPDPLPGAARVRYADARPAWPDRVPRAVMRPQFHPLARGIVWREDSGRGPSEDH